MELNQGFRLAYWPQFDAATAAIHQALEKSLSAAPHHSRVVFSIQYLRLPFRHSPTIRHMQEKVMLGEAGFEPARLSRAGNALLILTFNFSLSLSPKRHLDLATPPIRHYSQAVRLEWLVDLVAPS